MTILYVLAALLLLGILVTVHEAGHFMAARLCKIDVMEFAIGFGPKLVSWKSKKHDTKFSLRAIPVGGFCAFYGEDDVEGNTVDDPRAYNRQNVWKRMFTVAMGPGMNFILAFVVTLLFIWVGGVNDMVGIDPYIAQVNAAGAAYNAGLKDGDVIESINGMNMLDGTTDTLINTISNYDEANGPLHAVVRRGETTFETDITPMYSEAEGRYLMGVMVGGTYRFQRRAVDFFAAAGYAWDNCMYAGGMILTSLKDLVTKGEGLDQTSGPVGVVTLVSEQVATGGFDAFINYLVVISINLGIMNMLPIPGLDGSRLIFMVIEAIRRKPVPQQKEAMVHLCGMLLLFALMIFLTFKDVLALFK